MGEAAVEKSVGGPVEMVRQASKAAEAGLFQWVRLMSMLSISLELSIWFPFPFWMVDRFCFTWRRLFVVDHYPYGFEKRHSK